MSQLYERCQQTRQQTKAQLAEKYLKPLARPAAAARGAGSKGAVRKHGAAAAAAAGGGEAGA